LVLAGALGLSMGGFAGDVHAEVSFQGKTVSIIINSNPGGGTDTIARLVGSVLVKHLPGEPDVVYRNLPGGGGIQANNYFHSQVKPDGLTLLTGSNTQISPPKLRNNAVKYNPADYRYIGGTERLGSVMVVRNSERARLSDSSSQPLVQGDIDGERDGLLMGLWGKEFLGWNIRFVIGYTSVPTVELAARRGEIDVFANGNGSIIARMNAEGLGSVVQLGTRDDSDRIVRRAAFPDVPVFDDLITPKLSGQALKTYRSWRGDQLIDKWIALPPNTPDDIVETYRNAYQQATSDSKNKDVLQRAFGEDWGSYSGAAVDKIVKALVETSEEDLAYLIELKKKHGLPAN
jgi:tripartite-type tricarboxylate transporter receptor subunit TctC